MSWALTEDIKACLLMSRHLNTQGTPTFGYHSAKEEGVRLCTTIYEDARASGNRFVVSAMGREAGHLAFGIGTACHYPMAIIPEMFNKTKITRGLPCSQKVCKESGGV
jgi:6-phosphofructokinase